MMNFFLDAMACSICSRVSLWNLRMEPYGKESASVIFPEDVYPQFGQKDGPFLGALRRVSHSGQNLIWNVLGPVFRVGLNC
jgi:hypothetical protein